MQSPGDRVLEANSSNNWSYKEPNFTDDDYVLAPMRLPAFLLDKRQWIEAAVTGLKGIDFYPHPFNTLQLNPDKKKLIKALVKGFNTTGRKRFKGFDDIVQGKGRGLFFLLHGDSGLGKTFTAEAIAEETKRPLYHVSTGELGTGVKEMEMNLTEVFKLGWRWGAVVLIDEADVLVAKRTDNELERNAVVAMFLNLVEYYQGLLFVTTNREFSFDDAFENRMHAILKFPKLDFQARLNIWRNLIVNRLNPVPLDDSWSEDQEELEILAKLELNGRDIRNLIRTACAFASSYKKNLGVRHIAMVLREVCKASNLKEIIDELAPALKRVVTLPVEGGQRPFDTIDNEAEDANESEDDGEHDDDQSKPLGLIGGLPVEW
ncbi:P-loop containing nucleoside triphosphate hydrolase protein [Hyaloscypha sp. PMI_1271]|nr:P-loop containing nucleoside triphosphate hydrolase protein [Hyaloscypha sp. PMI_1271]